MKRKHVLGLLLLTLVLACILIAAFLLLGQDVPPYVVVTPLPPSPTVVFAITREAPRLPIDDMTPLPTLPVLATRAAIETLVAATAAAMPPAAP